MENKREIMRLRAIVRELQEENKRLRQERENGKEKSITILNIIVEETEKMANHHYYNTMDYRAQGKEDLRYYYNGQWKAYEAMTRMFEKLLDEVEEDYI